MQKKGNKYGTHRVIEPKGVLTQAAYKIDNNMDEIYSNEILCNVTALNVDSASFTQIADVCGHDDQKIGEMILSIVAERGKQQNPVTGSGGMFMGTVAKIGDDLKGKIDLKEGDRIASLVSLSLTPLKIHKILAVHQDIDRVDVEAQAILFESGIYAKLPDDMPTLRAFGKRMLENHIKPEYECFEIGHLDTALTLARKGQAPGEPMQFNFVLGVGGCTPATVPNLCYLVSQIPAGSTWTVTGIGRHAFTMAAAAIAMGGNVRVGFEDNLYLSKGVLAKSNGELVKKVADLAALLGRPVATPAEACGILGLRK